jgi:hypothetical protein
VLRGNVKKGVRGGMVWCGFRCLRFPRMMDVRLFFRLSCGVGVVEGLLGIVSSRSRKSRCWSECKVVR